MSDYKVEPYANFGTEQPWVARLALGLRELVFAVPAFGATREAFIREMENVLEALGMAFEELRTLRKSAAEGDTPALDVARSYAGLYGHLWQAWKDRFQAAMKALGLDIGFLFQNDANFEKGAAELIANRPELTELVDLMRRDRHVFQTPLAEYRNRYLEHRDEEPDPTLLAAFHRLDSAERMFDNVWQAIEDYVFLYVRAHLPPQIELVEIPELERDPSRPARFAFVVRDLPTEGE